MENPSLDISWKTIWKIVFTLGLGYLLFLIRQILVWLLFALIISILLRSLINFFYHRRVPYWLSVLLTYIVIFGALGGIIYISIPVVVQEIQQVIVAFPAYLPQLQGFLQRIGIQSSFTSFQGLSNHFLQQSPQDILRFLESFFGGLGATIFVLTMAIFLSFEKKGFGEMMAFLSARRYQKRILKAWKRSRREVSYWFGVRIIGATFITISYFLTYQLFGVKAALVLALIAGVFDFIPYFGPFVATLLGGLLVGLQISWPLAFVVMMILFAMQLIESHILTPLVGKKLIGLPPYLILLAIVIGGELFGFLGAFFAIPVIAIIYRFIIDFKSGEYQEQPEEEKVAIE